MRLPRSQEDMMNLFYLAGLFIGDGSGRKFIAEKELLTKKVIEICGKFGMKPKRVERKDRTPEKRQYPYLR